LKIVESELEPSLVEVCKRSYEATHGTVLKKKLHKKRKISVSGNVPVELLVRQMTAKPHGKTKKYLP